jgi:hypothetical protein
MSELREDLGELDACLARVPVPAGLEARIVAATTLQRVGPSSMRRSSGLALAFSAGVLLAVLALRERPTPPSEVPTVNHASSETSVEVAAPMSPTPVVKRDAGEQQPATGLAVVSERCAWSREDERLQFAAGCRMRLAEPAMDIEVWAPTQLEVLATGVAVREGVALFFVDPITDPRTPAVVGVSGGSIEILGTRFVVSQARERGHVDLIEGAIRFRRLDGVLDEVEAGRRYSWSSPATEADASAQTTDPVLPSTHEQTSTNITDDLAEGLAEVARLRRAGELAAAIAKLDALAREQSDVRTLEVISYERGTLIERSGSADAACQFWLEHRRDYPSGRYVREVDDRLAQLDCAR